MMRGFPFGGHLQRSTHFLSVKPFFIYKCDCLYFPILYFYLYISNILLPRPLSFHFLYRPMNKAAGMESRDDDLDLSDLPQ